MTKTKQATAKAGTAVAKPDTASKEVAGFDYGEEMAGAGYEQQDSSFLAIPFLAVLQSNSPQCGEEDSKARPGMFFNTVTGDLRQGSKGVKFLPAYVDHVFVEWVPRDKGGGGGAGFVGIHQPSSDVVREAQKRPPKEDKRSVFLTEAGNELVETYYMYGVVLDDDNEPEGLAVIAFTSTKIRAFRNYMSKLNYFNFRKAGLPRRPPLFANTFVMTTTKQKNTRGEFFNVEIEPAVNGSVADSMLTKDHPAVVAGYDVYQMVKSGRAAAAYDTEQATAGSGGSGGDEEIPF
jgi:hypothetical protein